MEPVTPPPFGRGWYRRLTLHLPCEDDIMTWKTPHVREVSLALEINGYAAAELADPVPVLPDAPQAASSAAEQPG
jgi:coenzyme PQQ precursor peptide PqqA